MARVPIGEEEERAATRPLDAAAAARAAGPVALCGRVPA